LGQAHLTTFRVSQNDAPPSFPLPLSVSLPNRERRHFWDKLVDLRRGSPNIHSPPPTTNYRTHACLPHPFPVFERTHHRHVNDLLPQRERGRALCAWRGMPKLLWQVSKRRTMKTCTRDALRGGVASVWGVVGAASEQSTALAPSCKSHTHPYPRPHPRTYIRLQRVRTHVTPSPISPFLIAMDGSDLVIDQLHILLQHGSGLACALCNAHTLLQTRGWTSKRSEERVSAHPPPTPICRRALS
jgi:hypothetical protein